MTARQFISHLAASRIYLSAKDGKLSIDAPKAKITLKLKAEINARKPELLALFSGEEDWQAIQARPCRFDVSTPSGFLAECQARGIPLSLTPGNQLVIHSNGRSNQALHDAMDNAALMAEVKELLRKVRTALPKTK